MSTLRTASLLALTATLVLSLGTGCKKKTADEGDAAADAAPAASATAEVADAAPAEEAKPTDVDKIPWHTYEQGKATKEINDTNYKSELDKLEAEISAAK